MVNKDIGRRDSSELFSSVLLAGNEVGPKGVRHANLVANAGLPLLCLQLCQKFAIWTSFLHGAWVMWQLTNAL